ncbi:MAG: phosphodiester glycosidase family protein [Myxococcota bacterium]
MRNGLLVFALLLGIGLTVFSNAWGRPASPWTEWASGFEVGVFPVDDTSITVVRLDPGKWALELVAGGDTAGNQTARQWAKANNLVAATNAGMFHTDYKTHVGAMKAPGRTDPANRKYQSLAVFGPTTPGLPPFRIHDLDAEGANLPALMAPYRYAIQNLRLIKRPGQNRWGNQPRAWSESALAEDDHGRPLMVFSRAPFSMKRFNQILLNLGIGVVAAQHLEGGPEAQLYLTLGGRELEMVGSYETGFNENDDNKSAWPVPNVIGVRPVAP